MHLHPLGTVWDGSGAQSSPKVAEAQTLLNAMGYGPLAVDGIFGANTKTAIERALSMTVMGGRGGDVVTDSMLDQLRKMAGSGHRAKLDAPPPTKATGPQNTGLADEPVWKKPLFLGLGVAAAVGLVLVLLKNETKVFSGSKSEGDAGPRRGRGRRLANGDATVVGDEVFGRYATPVDTDDADDAKPVAGTVTKRVKRRRCSNTPSWENT